MASTPDTVSSDYQAMLPYWTMVDTMLAGVEAMRLAGERYLPQFPSEGNPDYEYRRTNAKFTNIFSDIVDGLSEKPFAEPVKLIEGTASERVQALCEDIDGRGNNLHVFASNTFTKGVSHGLDWILVEYTKARPRADGQPLSLADEVRQGLRPYWVAVPAKSMIAVYSDTIRGKTEIVHARMTECIVRRDGFDEETIERVRQFDRAPILDEFGNIVDYAPATFTIWEMNAKANRNKGAWEIKGAGPVSIGVIPLVPYMTGRREGSSWRLNPPMKRAADLQVEHFQQETALKAAKELTAYPMLAGLGVTPPTGADGKIAQIPVGPKTVLYAPPFGDTGQHGDWKFVVVDAAGLDFLAKDITRTEEQLRELGRQPLTASAGITVVAAAHASQKASSAAQAWALGLKDALEQALKLTCMWLSDASAPSVFVFTDFAIAAGDDKGPDVLQKMRENGDLSRETLWAEARRRNILSAEFDAEEEQKRIDEELPDPDNEAELNAALGQQTGQRQDPPQDPLDDAA